MDLGIRLAAPAARTVCYVEHEAYPAALLAAHMEDGTLAAAPLWSGVESFDGKPWRGTVDIVAAGFSCQPWSGAGRRRGTEDERWIWPDIARIIREVGPAVVFLENVQPLVRGGIEHVLGTLAECGFATEWDVFSAAEVGAPHQRDRIFILAHAGRFGGAGSGDARDVRSSASENEAAARGQSPAAGRANGTGPRGEPERRGGDVADTAGRGLGERGSSSRHARLPDIGGSAMADAIGTERRTDQPGQRPSRRAAAERTGGEGGDSDMGDADVSRLERRRARPSGGRRDERPARPAGDPLADPDVHGLAGVESSGLLERTPYGDHADGCGGRRALPAFPPNPSDVLAWRTVPPDLEPAVCRVAYGLPNRRHRLRAAGNGVVPLVAAYAFVTLARRLGIKPTLDHLHD